MENMLIYAWILLTAVMNFSCSFIMSGVNKTFNGIYGGAIQSSVINFNKNGEAISPYFDYFVASKNIESYFTENLKKYTSSFDLEVKFYIYGTGIENTNTPTEIDIYMSTKIALIGKYEKSAAYYIERGRIYG